MTAPGFSCGSTALTASRDWVALINEIIGDDSDTVEVASTVLYAPHLQQTWDTRGADAPRVVEVAAAVERTLRDYTALWSPGFYRCLVLRARSDVQLLRSRALSVAIGPPRAAAVTAGAPCTSATMIELPADLVRAIEDYLDAERSDGCDPSGPGALNAAACIGARVVALWAVARRQSPVSDLQDRSLEPRVDSPPGRGDT